VTLSPAVHAVWLLTRIALSPAVQDTLVLRISSAASNLTLRAEVRCVCGPCCAHVLWSYCEWATPCAHAMGHHVAMLWACRVLMLSALGM